jgi:hypothetical protein
LRFESFFHPLSRSLIRRFIKKKRHSRIFSPVSRSFFVRAKVKNVIQLQRGNQDVRQRQITRHDSRFDPVIRRKPLTRAERAWPETGCASTATKADNPTECTGNNSAGYTRGG